MLDLGNIKKFCGWNNFKNSWLIYPHTFFLHPWVNVVQKKMAKTPILYVFLQPLPSQGEALMSGSWIPGDWAESVPCKGSSTGYVWDWDRCINQWSLEVKLQCNKALPRLVWLLVQYETRVYWLGLVSMTSYGITLISPNNDRLMTVPFLSYIFSQKIPWFCLLARAPFIVGFQFYWDIGFGFIIKWPLLDPIKSQTTFLIVDFG